MNHQGLIIESHRLIKNLNKSRKEILKIQEKKYRKILKYAYRNSVFYKDYYSSYGIHESDLSDIPITHIPSIDKKIFIEHFDEITTKPELNKKAIEQFVNSEDNIAKLYLDEYTILHSSGSTGLPTYFVYDKKAWQTTIAAAFRACKGDMTIPEIILKSLKKGLRILYIAATEGRFAGVTAASSGIKGFGFSPMLLNINTPVEQWIDKIRSFNPNAVIGYPSAIEILCDIINKNKINLNVIKLITAGEPLTKKLREYFQDTLKTEAINFYGSSESLALGFERDNFNGIYIFDDINYLEIENDSTYLTPLYNLSQPLIRYRLSDKLKSMEIGLKESVPFTKIEKIMGRNEEIMWFTNDQGKDDFLHPLVLDDIEVEGIINYQFVQLSEVEMEIKVVINENIDFEATRSEFSRQLNTILKGKNLDNIKYWITRAPEIAVNPNTGKKPIVIKKVS